MIEYFPSVPDKQRVHFDVLQLYTKHISVAGLSAADRIAAHYCALLRQRGLQRNNSSNGRHFCLCVYDALVAAGIAALRLELNVRADPRRNDDIDIRVTVSALTQRYVLFYLKTSLRERWKQIDRDARYAKEQWGKGATTVCLIFAEYGLEGFLADISDPKALNKQMHEREYWAPAVDYYIALSQRERVNALIATIAKDVSHDDFNAGDECRPGS
jgi:hypothetical protein